MEFSLEEQLSARRKNPFSFEEQQEIITITPLNPSNIQF